MIKCLLTSVLNTFHYCLVYLLNIWQYHTLRYTFRVSVCFLWLACNVQLFWKYCNKDCNWEGLPNSIPFKLRGIPYENLGLNSFQLRRKENCTDPCYNFNLVRHLEHCCCREFVCLTENCWSWLGLAMVIIGNGHWRNMDDAWWSNIILKFLIKHCSRIPDIRYCSRLADVKHWAKMLMLDTWPATTTQPCSAKRCSR